MAKMIDLGYKIPKDQAVPSQPENKEQYPSLHLHRKVPPEIMDKEIGSMCRFEVVGKVVSKSIDEGMGGGEGKSESVTIEVQKMGYIGKAGKATKEEYLDKSPEDRTKYDEEEVLEGKE